MSDISQSADSRPPRGRRFRFSLRTLLLAMLVLGTGFGLVGMKLREVYRQRSAVGAIMAQGGNVGYDFQFDANGDWIRNAETPGPAWLRRLVGIDFFAHVQYARSVTREGSFTDASPLADLPQLKEVWLSDTGVTDLTPLAQLTELRTLHLSGTPVTDLTPLANLRNLRVLYLSYTQVTDVTPLAKLTSLERLYLIETPVRDISPLSGLSELVELDLMMTDVADISPLETLTKLRILNVHAAPVSYEQQKELQRALPNMRFVRDG